MEFSPRYVAIFLLSIGISNVAVAGIDAACMPIINSSEARAAKAAWESVTVVSPNDFKMEAMKVAKSKSPSVKPKPAKPLMA